MNIRSRRRLPTKLLTGLLALSVLYQTGCGPTYPKEIVDKAVVDLCKREYGIDVKVELAGTTIAIYLPIEDILTQGLKISEAARDKINDVTLSVARVTLSSDAPIQFYVIIAQDPEFPELQGVIIQNIMDIKLYSFGQISRGEFSNRAIAEWKLTPQAQKEQMLKSVFEQLEIEQDEELFNAFMAKDVGAIADIGYWNGQFYIKEINLEEFLALQIAERSKRKLGEDTSLKERFTIKAISSAYIDRPSGKSFEFELDAMAFGAKSEFMNKEDVEALFKTVLDTAAHVLREYKYENYNVVTVRNKIGGERMDVLKSELAEFKKGKIKIGDLRWRR